MGSQRALGSSLQRTTAGLHVCSLPVTTIVCSIPAGFPRSKSHDFGILPLLPHGHRPLGELERSVMEALWSRVAPATVKDVAELLSERGLAYTTLMTTLDRLFKKGLLVREKQGHAYAYSPAVAKEAYVRGLVADMLGALKGAPRDALLTGFLDFAAADPAGLESLERMIVDRKQGDA